MIKLKKKSFETSRGRWQSPIISAESYEVNSAAEINGLLISFFFSSYSLYLLTNEIH